jgi:hypothetical protein
VNALAFCKSPKTRIRNAEAFTTNLEFFQRRTKILRRSRLDDHRSHRESSTRNECAGGEVSQTLYLEAFKEVLAIRLKDTQQRLERFQQDLRRYEIKYQCAYEEFSAHLLDTVAGHDDWIA